MERFDVAVIGAGAAGLYCAGIAGQRGARVVVLDHGRKLAEKVRISGGGRCNFTNRLAADPARYLSADPDFARTALAAHPPERFIALLRTRRIGFHEKHRGQLFCDDSSQRIIDLLRDECARGRVSLRHPVEVTAISRLGAGAGDELDGARRARFELETTAGRIAARYLVVATGGLSIPAIGASDFAWRLAAVWGLATVAPRAALVPFMITDPSWAPFAALSGLSVPVRIGVVPAGTAPAGTTRAGASFDEDLLFTHRGLSGPAALQISSFWQPGDALRVDLLPGDDVGQRLQAAAFAAAGAPGPGARVATVLAGWLPRRLAAAWLAAGPLAAGSRGTGLRAADLRSAGARAAGVPVAAPVPAIGPEDRIADLDAAQRAALAAMLSDWRIRPAGTEGYRKAEVTAGGVATAELDPRTLESWRVPGSYWIGEAVDVTGWLGGYNFQWAWSSASAAAMAIVNAFPRSSRPVRGASPGSVR